MIRVTAIAKCYIPPPRYVRNAGA